VFYGISALIGAVTAVMISVNGGLTAVYGVFCATMIIHLVGTAAAFLVLRARGMKLNLKTCGAPAWMYLGGAIGYFTSAFNNLSYGKISFTAIVALGLLGQMATAFFIDTFGLFGMKKVPFRLSVLVGFVCAGLGVAVMLRGARLSARLAVAAAFAAGITLVLSRTVNAGLSRRIGGLQGSLVNHVVGLPISVAAALAFGRAEPLFRGAGLSPKIWIYVGGAMGVLVVFLSNVTVPKVSAFRFAMLCFVGQMATAALIDLGSGKTYPAAMLAGTALVAAGVMGNLLLERRK
jgi:bacterial/archaeal transporter family-2 protein